MHQQFETADPIVARFSFKPDRAHEFLEDGQQVTQLEFESVDAVYEAAVQFADALLDANAIIDGNVVNLSDYKEEN